MKVLSVMVEVFLRSRRRRARSVAWMVHPEVQKMLDDVAKRSRDSWPTTPLVLRLSADGLRTGDLDEALRSALGILKPIEGRTVNAEPLIIDDIPEADAKPSREQIMEWCRTVFAPKQLPDYATYKELTDPPPAFPESIAEALEELRRQVWAAGYPVGEITIGTTTDHKTNEVTLFAEADVIPWKEES